MERRDALASHSNRWRLSRRLRHVAVMPTETPPAVSPGLMVKQTVWLAMASSLLEVLLVEGHWGLIGTVTMVSVRLNQHHLWMRPLACLMLLFPIGLLAALVLKRRPGLRWVDGWATYLLCVPAILSPLWSLEELHPWAAVALACGIGRLGALWVRRYRSAILGPGLWAVMIVTGGVAAIGLYRNVAAEPITLATLPKAQESAPNLVLLVLDTVRADHLSHHGYARDTMPRLKALAERGVWFENARATAPWTLPSHASMMTGRWYHELPVDVQRPMDQRFPTIAEHLTRLGYRAAGFVGNTVYCNTWFGMARGFAHYEDSVENRHVSLKETLRSSGLGHRFVRWLARVDVIESDDEFARPKTAAELNRDVGDWLDRQATDSPYFLFLNYFDAHGPYVVPDGFPRVYSGDREPEFRQVVKRYRRIDRKHRTPQDTRTEEELSRLGVDAYDDCLRYLDERISELLADLGTRGRAQGRETWVVITSDHGEHFGERGLHRHGNSLYRPLVHVPLVVARLGGEDSSMGQPPVREPVSLRDLPATLAALASPSENPPFPGRSLSRFWEGGPNTSERSALVDPLLSELLFHPQMDDGAVTPTTELPARMFHSVVDHDRVYIETRDDKEELYDLYNDPDEAHDLAGESGAERLIQAFRERLVRLLGPSSETSP